MHRFEWTDLIHSNHISMTGKIAEPAKDACKFTNSVKTNRLRPYLCQYSSAEKVCSLSVEDKQTENRPKVAALPVRTTKIGE
jgi:hypothetical protein